MLHSNSYCNLFVASENFMNLKNLECKDQRMMENVNGESGAEDHVSLKAERTLTFSLKH